MRYVHKDRAVKECLLALQVRRARSACGRAMRSSTYENVVEMDRGSTRASRSRGLILCNRIADQLYCIYTMLGMINFSSFGQRDFSREERPKNTKSSKEVGKCTSLTTATFHYAAI